MTDDSDSADGSTPGGGPTRVVSEASVDDILESIDSSPEPDRDDPGDETQRDEVNRDETKGPDESADSSERPLESDDEDEFNADSIDDSKQTTTTIETGQPADPNAVVADADSSAAPADETARANEPTPQDESASEQTDSELSARIERGAVTGADVRAAEAGEGREETSDIGDIDLSMDDLESSNGRSASSESKRGRSSTDGPLSATIGSDDPESDDGGDREDGTAPDRGDTDESEAASSSSGVFQRLKGLFSR